MTESNADPLSSYRWNARVLLVIAPKADHPLVLAQRQVLSKGEAGVIDRDLVIHEAVDSSPGAQSIRRRFKVDEQEARVILVGKDGGDKLRSSQAIPAAELFSEIDAMPMRRQEMRGSQQ